MKLIIAEKKIAGERIAKILSNGKYIKRVFRGIPVYFWDDYILIPLQGHLIEHDFPNHLKDWKKTPILKLLNTKPIEYFKNKRIAQILRKFAKKVDTVIIATDYDREGELIGFEALKVIRSVNPFVKVFRAKFSAITREEILKAFKNLEKPNKNLADSALARRLIDLYWGVCLTRLLSILGKRIKGRKVYSVGRVQTPTLKLIVEREKEIMDFVPEKYWKVYLDIGDILIELNRVVKERKELEKFRRIKRVYLYKINDSIVKIPQPEPYNTTSFLKDCFRFLGISVKKAMKIAEYLYMNGFISYPRTSNTVYPQTIDLKFILKKLSKMKNILGDYARELLNKKLIVSRGKIFDTDHPPIHPTNPAERGYLKGKYWKVYELVVRRFYATVSGPAIGRKVVLLFKDDFNNIYFYEGFKIIEKNWLKYFNYVKYKEKPIKILKEGYYAVENVIFDERKTEPPPRYSEGSLIKEMEKLNLGTKSTRHEIISKLFEREYVKGKRSIRPTEYAFKIIDVLEKYCPEITKPEMTAKLELEMEEIAKGKKKLEDVLKDSLQILRRILVKIISRKEDVKKLLI